MSVLKLRSHWVLGLALCFPAFLSAAAPPAGPLRIHPENPRVVTDGARMPDGSLRAVYLTGSHTWNNLVEWINPSQSEPAGRERLNAGDGTRQFQAPFEGGAVLHLKAQSQAGLAQERAPIHAVVDLGHEFTFYADGRFHRQYLPDQPVAMSWGALFHYDFANANLLILLGCDPHLRYVPEDIRTITAFLEEGGGVVLLGSTADEPQNDLAREFGCTFGPPAHKPLQSASAPIAGEIAGGGDTLNLQETNLWRVLVVDAQGNPMLARRTVGKGTLLVGARGLAGHNPDASDNINAAWWRPLLADVASGKRVDPAKPFRGRGWGELELSESLGSITLRYSSYLKPYAKSMADIYARCRPVIEQRMGVPLSEGMASEIVLLATGGGGFSSGRTLGLAAFWGGFPDREDSMIEFITHESVHSWVLPFAEIWNEPIATYIGNLVMIDMGHEAEAQRRIRDTIARATRLDSTMTLYDLEGKGRAGARELRAGEANGIHWGKTFWIFEQLRQEHPDVVARYFQAKRRLATPDKIQKYDVHATVAVLSVALGRDLFPWFNEHGIEADPGKSPIPLAAEAPTLRPRGHVFFQAGPPFTGHDLPRLRGAMISPDIDAAGLRVLGREWNANLIRWQLIRRGRAGQPSSLEDYDAWLEGELKKLDAALPLCREIGLYVVVDLHSPPGGKGTSGGYVGSDDRLFTDPACQAKFVQVWQRIAARYKGAQPIWGYDLVNEPVEDSVAEECDDWQGLAERAARAVRAIDPARTILVEPASWGGPSGLNDLVPLPISNVVYSVHMYLPHAFTHQGVYGSGPAYRYPGVIEGKQWDKAQLEAAMQPVIDFQRAYGVHIYIGEFSAIRWAPDESAYRYLKDLIEIFEAHGWDWSYHAFREWSGWSVEHGSDRSNTKPSAEPTNRQRLLRHWFAQNRKPAWSEERHDWPCWRGPERNGVSREEAWGWPRGLGDPAVLWRASVGKGFSSFAVADGRVYTLGNTEDQDTVSCLAADTGTVRWRHTYPCELQPLSYEGGPSATPAVDGQRVYTFSKGGDLFCLNAHDGTVVWSKKFSPWPYREGDWRNTWRYASSPLVLGDRLFLNLGESGMAFNKEDGAMVWESAAGHPGYSSPVPFETPAGQALAFFSGQAVYGVDRSSGRQLWSIPWKTLWDLNAADPIVHDGKVFVSSGNGVGCALFDISVTPPRECWRNKNLKSTINTAVLWRGHLYGFNDTHLSCLSWETGEEQWTTRDVRNGSLIVASNRLILLSETGKLVVAEASPQGYQPLAQAQVLEGRCWTTPVLSHGLLFVRNAAGQVVCLDLRKP